VNIVYRAGYSDSEKVVRTDLKGLKNAIEAEKEKDLFSCLSGSLPGCVFQSGKTLAKGLRPLKSPRASG